MQTRRLAGVTVACTLLWAAAGPHWARAQGGGARLRIDCSSPLDEAARAALEARSRAELTSLPPQSAGEVTITCSRNAAVLQWTPRNGKRREKSVPLGDEPSDAVEGILAALDSLLFEAPAEAEDASPPPPAPDAAPTTPLAPPGDTAPATPFPAAAPAERPTGPEGAPGDFPAAYGTGLTLGADSELWSGGVTGALGAHAGVRLAASRRWSVLFAAGDLWATSAPQSVQSQTLRALAGVDYDLLRAVRVGLAADARVMLAQQGSSSLSNAATAGLLVSARYVARLGSFQFSVGPQGELLYRPLIVHVSGAEVFRVPTALLGLSLDAAVGLGEPEASP